jgi:ABC-type multidrug transport system ATPase subunit
MRIVLDGLGKKYHNRWIFRNVNFVIPEGQKTAITGFNGSGKSTMLQVIAGYINPSEGKVSWTVKDKTVDPGELYRHIAFASPYLDLIEEFTLSENADFFIRNKPLLNNINAGRLIEISGVKDAADRQLRFFSSGMKQRIRLTFAFMADTPLLLLDEPLSNLDEEGYNWYAYMLNEVHPQRTVIICSNRVKEETSNCTAFIDLQAFKK